MIASKRAGQGRHAGGLLSAGVMLCCLLFSGRAGAEDLFRMRGGLALVLAGQSERYTAFPALTVSPEVRLAGFGNVSLSLMAPLSAGLWTESVEGRRPFANETSGTSFGADLPLMLNLNLGSAAARNGAGGFGVVLGYGRGYHLSSSSRTRQTDVYRDARATEPMVETRSNRVRFGNEAFHVGLVFEQVMLRLSFARDPKPRDDRSYAVSAGILIPID